MSRTRNSPGNCNYGAPLYSQELEVAATHFRHWLVCDHIWKHEITVSHNGQSGRVQEKREGLDRHGGGKRVGSDPCCGGDGESLE